MSNLTPPEAPRKQISLRLSAELVARLERMAKREQRNRSNMIEYLLREAVRDEGER